MAAGIKAVDLQQPFLVEGPPVRQAVSDPFGFTDGVAVAWDFLNGFAVSSALFSTRRLVDFLSQVFITSLGPATSICHKSPSQSNSHLLKLLKLAQVTSGRDEGKAARVKGLNY